MPKLKEIIGETAYNALPEETRKQHGEVDFVNSTEYVSKKDYDTSQETAKKYKEDLDKADKDLKDIQEKVKDNETLNKEISDLRENNKKEKEDYDAKLAQLNFNTKLEKKLGEFKPKNLDILMKALDSSKIKLDGEDFLGLTEQIDKLKESDAYLFGETVTGGTGKLGGGAGSSGSNIITDNTQTESLGTRLAKAKAEANKVTEAQTKFFG